jgi:archaellin
MFPDIIDGLMPAKASAHDVRAQGNISTLIILIAGLLVASITAGVLFDVVGGFQTTAASAAGQNADQLSSRIVVLGAGGQIADDRIREVNLTLARDGNNPVNLSEIVVSGAVGDGGSAAIGESDYLRVTAAVDDDGSIDRDILNHDDDRATVTIELVGLFGTTLRAGDSEQIRLLTPAGSTATVRLTVPSPLPDTESVAL